MLAENFALPLVGALWACTTLTLTVTCELNRIRNVILLGHDDGQAIPVSLRAHMMYHDWLPILGCIISACLGFSAISAYSPNFLAVKDQTASAWSIAIGVGVYTFLMAAIWIPTACSDWKIMKEAIRKDSQSPIEQLHSPKSPPQEI